MHLSGSPCPGRKKSVVPVRHREALRSGGALQKASQSPVRQEQQERDAELLHAAHPLMRFASFFWLHMARVLEIYLPTSLGTTRYIPRRGKI